MKVRYGDKQLIEANYGFDFNSAQLRYDLEMQRRLTKFLQRNKVEMEVNVIDGSQPLFGYPLVCYNERSSKQDHEYLRALCCHVLR